MDNKDLRTLKILEEIEKNNYPSQRELANKLNISLGLVNSFIKRLSNKGLFKITTLPRNRIKYILTPKGFSEKSRLTFQYIQLSYGFYKNARHNLKLLFDKLEKNGARKMAFFKANNFAEIAYLSLLETDIIFVAIFDEDKIGEVFFKHVIKAPSDLHIIDFDKLLITTDETEETTLNQIMKTGISSKKIVSFEHQ